MIRAAGLLAPLLLAACGCPPFEEGRRLYAEAIQTRDRSLFDASRTNIEDAISHCALSGKERLEPLALLALCHVQLGDATAARTRLDEAAAKLSQIHDHEFPATDPMLLSLARASHHRREAETALRNVLDPKSRHAAMLARVAAQQAQEALVFYDEALALARDPVEREFLQLLRDEAERLQSP